MTQLVPVAAIVIALVTVMLPAGNTQADGDHGSRSLQRFEPILELVGGDVNGALDAAGIPFVRIPDIDDLHVAVYLVMAEPSPQFTATE